MKTRFPVCSALLSSALVIGVIFLTPVAHAQVVATTDDSVQGSNQGVAQGVDQGTNQGGPTLESLGLAPDENGEYDTSVLGDADPRQGALQGVTNGAVTADVANDTTGINSTNASSAAVSQGTSTDVANSSETTNAADSLANTGQNSASENTGSSGVGTGNAGVGVQQVTTDNLATPGSYGEIEHSLSAGSQNGDLVLGFDPTASGDALVDSFRSVNTVTGAGSDNTADITSNRTAITEIQNDGVIHNDLDVAAVTGQNDASQNTGNASILTGDANVAASILNFLNTNVVDGALWFSVADIFGDLNGNIIIPEEAIAYLERQRRELLVAAANTNTGSASTNTVDVDVEHTETTEITNVADVLNDVTIDAITGHNTVTQNTGGSTIVTGDVAATTNTVTLANMNVVDGNLGLVIVNALNRWLGFLLGSDGAWTPIGHDYTTIVNAENSSTGADSTNTVDVDVEHTETTDVASNATVTNDLDLTAITGQNTVSQNTGNASVKTGNARVNATVVNVVNTNVVRGGFFTTIVNVFGNWLGDLFFGSQPVSSLASSSGAASAGGGTSVQASNANTGQASENAIAVDVSSDSTLVVENAATIENDLTMNADTGHNEASRNTGLGSIETGDVVAALHARNVANVTLAGVASTWANITADLANATTGASSTNTIDVTVNDDRRVVVLNDANVDTAIGAVANTGFNTASRNTLGGLIVTGVASVDALIENLLNETWLAGGHAYGDGPENGGLQLAAANENTGSGSTNANAIHPDVSTDVVIGNSADVSNGVDVVATTGNNHASRNTGGGAVGSGTTDIEGGIDNAVNQTAVFGGVSTHSRPSDTRGDPVPGGSLDLEVASAADIANTVAAAASTGNNDVSRNTGSLSLPRPPSSSGPTPPRTGSSEESPPPTTEGVGGGPALAFTASEEFSSHGAVVGEGGEKTAPMKKPVARKPKIASTKAASTQGKTPAVAGELGGGPSWDRVARQVLGVPEAQARSEDSITSVRPAGLPAAPRDVGASGRPWEKTWPWAALVASALVFGLSSTKRGRMLVHRLTAPRRP